MLLRLKDNRVLNTEYCITLGVGKIKEDPGFHHVIAQLINGQPMSLGKHLKTEDAEKELDELIQKHNLHHMVLHEKH